MSKDKVEVIAKEDLPIVKQEVRTPVCNECNVKPRNKRTRVITINEKPSMTKQSDKKLANINSILGRYKKTGLIPLRQSVPIEGDLPDVDSYHEAMTVITQSQQAFDQLPSDIKEKFDGDPKKFLEFVQDEENEDKLIEMGLAKAKEVVETIQKVEVVDTTDKKESDQGATESQETAKTE